jgi:NADH-quinone oxidoreductase subunit A
MSQNNPFLYAFAFLLAGAALVLIGLLVAKLIRPHRPNEEKLSTYECGEEPVGNAWGRFNIRFFLIAMLFVLFEVELLFLFPWALVFAQPDLLKASTAWGWVVLAEMFMFIGMLALGLLYAWKSGLLRWNKTIAANPPSKSPVPGHLYEDINSKYR